MSQIPQINSTFLLLDSMRRVYIKTPIQATEIPESLFSNTNSCNFAGCRIEFPLRHIVSTRRIQSVFGKDFIEQSVYHTRPVDHKGIVCSLTKFSLPLLYLLFVLRMLKTYQA